SIDAARPRSRRPRGSGAHRRRHAATRAGGRTRCTTAAGGVGAPAVLRNRDRITFPLPSKGAGRMGIRYTLAAGMLAVALVACGGGESQDQAQSPSDVVQADEDAVVQEAGAPDAPAPESGATAREADAAATADVLLDKAGNPI